MTEMFNKEQTFEAYAILNMAVNEARAASADLDRASMRADKAQMQLKEVIAFVAEHTQGEQMPDFNFTDEFSVLDGEILRMIKAGMNDGNVGVTRRHLGSNLSRRNQLWTRDLIQRRLVEMRANGTIEYIHIPQPKGRAGRPLERYVTP